MRKHQFDETGNASLQPHFLLYVTCLPPVGVCVNISIEIVSLIIPFMSLLLDYFFQGLLFVCGKLSIMRAYVLEGISGFIFIVCLQIGSKVLILQILSWTATLSNSKLSGMLCCVTSILASFGRSTAPPKLGKHLLISAVYYPKRSESLSAYVWETSNLAVL